MKLATTTLAFELDKKTAEISKWSKGKKLQVSCYGFDTTVFYPATKTGAYKAAVAIMGHLDPAAGQNDISELSAIIWERFVK